MALAISAVLTAACSAAGAPASQTAQSPQVNVPSSAATAVAPGVTPEPTAPSTASPEIATPEPTADPEAVAEITQVFIRAWKDAIDKIEYQVVIEVTNTGTGFADLTTSDKSFTIYHTDGSVLETGSFTYTFPQVIGPGETGYYVESGFFDDGTTVNAVGEIEPSIGYGQATGPNDAYPVSKIKVGAEQYGEGLQVSGVVKNDTTEDATMGMVGVIFFDADDVIIGALYDNTGVSDLRAGQTKGFKTTYPGTPPLKATQVKSWKAYAFDYSFF